LTIHSINILLIRGLINKSCGDVLSDQAYSFLLLSGPLCGVIMVLGGILLLYKGAITLNNSSEGALSVEFKKELRITTQYPALGIFVIGLLFIIVPAFLGKPSEAQRLTVKATPINVSEPVKIQLQAAGWSSNLHHSGQIIETHHPVVDIIQIVISAPGYEPLTRTVQLSDLSGNTADLGEVELRQKLSKAALKRKILPIPNNIEIPGINVQADFGGTK